MKAAIKKKDVRVYDQALYTDVLIPCGYWTKGDKNSHRLVVVCNFKQRTLTLVVFDDWDTEQVREAVSKIGNHVKNIGLKVGLKCDGNISLEQESTWEIKNFAPYYQLDSQLEEIDESDRLIAFISGVMLRGTSVDEQIAYYSKNGKKDTEVWKRLQLLQATYVAKQVGADKVTPFKKGVIVGKPN
jgi:hypothetical protein